MRHSIVRFAFRRLGVDKLYEEVVVQDRLTNIRPQIRQDITNLLKKANSQCPFFEGKFTEFLSATNGTDDDSFFQAYAALPAYSKEDYANAGNAMLKRDFAQQLESGDAPELVFDGKALSFLKRLKSGKFFMPMATGGSTSLPLKVQMTKHHMFSMLYTFFKCWFRQGWTPGERMMVFYPRNTYNIDDMARYNKYSRFTGFQIHLFDKVDLPTIRELVKEINRFKPKMLLVFPSPMNMIATTIRKHNLQLTYHPELINVSGETFFDCQRNNIQEVFSGSKIEDSYGSVELGEIAHETPDRSGLEIFANVAYVETAPNENGKPEMICTRLHLDDFPFIRYKMKDIADIEFQTDAKGNERYVITKIEGKDSNFIMSSSGERFYPSFFNNLVNQVNAKLEDSVVEIKVYERGGTDLEVQLITKSPELNTAIEETITQLLTESMGDQMNYDIRFVDFIDHDYRRKYRVIERIGDVEYAGGIVGNQKKLEKIERESVET